MENFLVSDGNILAKDYVSQALADGESLLTANFQLLILSEQEWDRLPGLYPQFQNFPLDLKTLRTMDFPQIRRLSSAVHYVCYKDLDAQGEELAVRFLLSAEEFIMIGWNGINLERISKWVQSGLAESPFHLAQILGVRVLRHFQTQLEKLEDQMDNLEEIIMKEPRITQQSGIIVLQSQVISLKKSLNAHQSIFTRLANLMPKDFSGFWQELVQDTQRELENARQTHELVQNLRETFQAAVDNRANDIMKWLTLLATILLPINILTSFFGMNFQYMPLIYSTYGFMVFCLLSAAIVLTAFIIFWRKKWLRE
jgi:magnesium transporter